MHAVPEERATEQRGANVGIPWFGCGEAGGIHSKIQAELCPCLDGASAS